MLLSGIAAASLGGAKLHKMLKITEFYGIIRMNGGANLSESKLVTQSTDFAVSVINLVKSLKEKRESIISNQIGRSGTSIGANIREAKYTHSRSDFIENYRLHKKNATKLNIGLKLLRRQD